jgi:hypothetical protein
MKQFVELASGERYIYTGDTKVETKFGYLFGLEPDHTYAMRVDPRDGTPHYIRMDSGDIVAKDKIWLAPGAITQSYEIDLECKMAKFFDDYVQKASAKAAGILVAS